MVCLTKIHTAAASGCAQDSRGRPTWAPTAHEPRQTAHGGTATRYLDERRTAYDERSSLKRRDDDVAQGYAAYDGQCRYDEGCDEDQGIVLENRHGLEDVRKDVDLAIEEDMLDQGKHVFLDLKVHDIPNTVGQSIRALTRLGADLMTLHGTGGRAMMEAAAEAVRDEAAKLNIERTRLLAVTVLTSIDEDAWKEIGGKYSIAESVKNLAKLAKEAGIDGTVSSPYEAKEIREMNGPDFLIVTPGIRPTFAVANDQKRFTTPSQALRDGASHLVIGRPITKAADPKEAAEKILAEIQGV